MLQNNIQLRAGHIIPQTHSFQINITNRNLLWLKEWKGACNISMTADTNKRGLFS